MRAENGTQTRDPQLGRLVLYRLSYFRETYAKISQDFRSRLASRVGADGFEPPKLKSSRFTVCPIWPLWNTPNFSIKFDHFANLQIFKFSNLQIGSACAAEPLVGLEPTTA